MARQKTFPGSAGEGKFGRKKRRLQGFESYFDGAAVDHGVPSHLPPEGAEKQ
jgi:hypothetical protein